MTFGAALRKSNRKRGKMVVLAEVCEICLGCVSIWKFSKIFEHKGPVSTKHTRTPI